MIEFLVRHVSMVWFVFLLSAGAALGQSADYNVSGTLSNPQTSGTDPLNFRGQGFTVSTTLGAPSSVSPSPTSSMATYTNASITLAAPGHPNELLRGPLTCADATVVITDTATGADSLTFSGCILSISSWSGQLVFPAGTLVTSAPMAFPNTSATGSVGYATFLGSASFSLESTSASASGSAPPSASVDPTEISFEAIQGGASPASQSVVLSTSPDYPRSFTLSKSGSWLSVTPTSGNTSIGLTVSASLGSLTVGTYSGSITVDFGAGESTVIPVALTVSPSLVALNVSPASLIFNYQKGGGAPSAQSLSVSSSPSSTSITAAASTTSGGSWLSVSPTGGTTPQDLSVTVSSLDSLAAGSYQGKITVTGENASNNPREVAVTLNVTVPDLIVSPSSLDFEYTIGQSTPTSQKFSLSSNVSVTYNASESTSWFSVSPASGTASATPTDLTVSINTSSLASPGTFNGNITIGAPGAASEIVAVSITVTKPVLTVSPSAIVVNHTIGTGNPASQSIDISSTPSIAFNVSASTDSGGNWLSVSPTSGSGSVSAAVSVDPSGLAAGSYSGSIAVSASGADNKTVVVTLNVTAPVITVGTSSLNFGYQIGGAIPAAQNVSVSTSPPVAFTAAASGGGWLAVSPTSGSGSGDLSVSVTPGSLTAGTYNGTVTVSATGAIDKVINVTLTVSAAPTLTVSPGSLTFNYQIGGTNPTPRTVNVSTPTPVAYSASASGGSWLSVSPGSGDTPATLSVSVNPSGLGVGAYNGTVTVSSAAVGNSPQTVTVTLVVSAAPTISVSPSQLAFAHQIGGSAPAAQTLSVSATSPVTFIATASGGSWLSVSPGSGSTSATLNVSVNPSGLVAGAYNGTVVVSSAAAGNSPQAVTVTLVVSAPTITVDPRQLTFSYQLGGANPDSQSIAVSADSTIAFTATTSGGDWLSVTPGSGNTPGSLSVTVDPSGLEPGIYAATVLVSSVSAGNSPQATSVSLMVIAAPVITVNPSFMEFSFQIGGQAPLAQAFTVATTPAGPFDTVVATSSGGNWLLVSPSSGNGGGTVSVSVDPEGLPAGIYDGTIAVTSSGADNKVVAVELTVSDQPVLHVSPVELNFSHILGGPVPDAQTIGVSASEAISFSASASGGAWLSVTPTTGEAGLTAIDLSVVVDPAGLEPGMYHGMLTITAAAAGNSPAEIVVHLSVDPPMPSVNDVVSHATLIQGDPVPAGGLAVAIGEFPGVPYEAASAIPLPPDLSGVILWMRNKPTDVGGKAAAAGFVAAPLLFVSDSQILFQVPWEMTAGTVEVVVSVNGVESQTKEIHVGEFAPGIFMDSIHFAGPFPAVAYGVDGVLAWPVDAVPQVTTQPIKIGAPLTILATGLGPVTGPAPVTGDNSFDENGDWVRRDTVEVPTVLIGGQPADVSFAGLSPEFVGVYQVNLTAVPDTVQPGEAVPLVIEMKGVPSREDVVIAVDPAK